MSMSVESWKSFFEIGGVILLFLTFAFGAGFMVTGKIVNARQEKQLRQFDSDLTTAKGALSVQQERAANADARVAGLEQNAADAKTEMALQQTRAATAERSLLELQDRIKHRKLTDKQSADFVKVLKTLPNARVKFGYTAGGADEGLNLAKQLLALFKEAGWGVPEDTSHMTNHLDIQVIGVGVLVRPQTDLSVVGHASQSTVMTTKLGTLQAAFRAVGIDLQFFQYDSADENAPEVVVGSKPE